MSELKQRFACNRLQPLADTSHQTYPPYSPIRHTAKSPLAAYQSPNKVKLCLFDVGLLCRMLDLGYPQSKQQAHEYKGYIAEDFVQQEFAAQGVDPTYSWQDARAEIEFILSDSHGNIIPIEVKSGKRTRARSLQSCIQKCNPVKTIKLTGTQGSSALEGAYCHAIIFCAVCGQLSPEVSMDRSITPVCHVADYMKPAKPTTCGRGSTPTS